MRRSFFVLVLAAITIFSCVTVSHSQYTTDRITNNEVEERLPQINSSGWVVWMEWGQTGLNVFLYNGTSTTQLTTNGVAGYPQINNNGDVVWVEWTPSDVNMFLYDGTSTTQIPTNGAGGLPLINDNGWVVWAGYEGSGSNIFLYDGTNTTQLTTDGASDFPQIGNNGEVVWVGDVNGVSAIFLYDGTSTTQLSNSLVSANDPQINDNGWVVWTEYDGSSANIFLYDGTSTIQLSNNFVGTDNPQINDNGWVVWEGDAGSGANIFLYDGLSTTQLTADGASFYPQIDNNGNVVWLGSDLIFGYADVFLYDGTSTTQLSNASVNLVEWMPQGIPQISDNGYVVWIELLNGAGDIILAIPGASGEGTVSYTTTQITNNAYEELFPQINDDGWVVWLESGQTGSDVLLYDGTSTTQLTTNGASWRPQINDNGWVVWIGYDDTSAIFLYDGTSTTQLSNSPLGDWFWRDIAQINNNGWVVWEGDGVSGANIFLYDGTSTIQLGNDKSTSPRINDDGWVVWMERDLSSGYSDIFLYDGTSIIQLSNDPNIDNYQPDMNNIGQVVWTGVTPPGVTPEAPTSHIFLYDGTSTTQLTNSPYISNESPQINDNGYVVWWGGDESGAALNFLYDGLSTTQLSTTDFSIFPQINDNGWVVWIGVYGDSYADIFLYDGTSTTILSNNPVTGYNFPQINNNGDVVWIELANPQGELFLGVPDASDADNDGTPDEEDCAPLDPEIHPGAIETCNGVDDNCDELIDTDCDIGGMDDNLAESNPDSTVTVTDEDGDGIYEEGEILEIQIETPNTNAITVGDVVGAQISATDPPPVVESNDETTMTTEEVDAAAQAIEGITGYSGETEAIDVVEMDSQQMSSYLGTDDYDLLIEIESTLTDTDPLCEAELSPNAFLLFCDGDYDLATGNCSGTMVLIDERCADSCSPGDPIPSPTTDDICYRPISRAPDRVEVRNIPHSTAIISISLLDADGDGYWISTGDCNDLDPTIYPGAMEVPYDGIDQDCDEADLTDVDGDDYDAEVVGGDDCDDTDPAINPGTAKETNTEYVGQYVFMVDDYSGTPPTADVVMTAVVTAEATPVAGWEEVVFEVVDPVTGELVVDPIPSSTDNTGTAIANSYDIPVGVYNVEIMFVGDDCYYHSSADRFVMAVYDPTGGFGTGGGWYVAEEEASGLTGRANFGFNVKYKQDVSTGNLEFQFQVGDLNLKSTNIDWLVMSSENAQFKGQGRVNGVEGHFFRVIAKDFGEPGVGVDEFDIKVWDGDPDATETTLIHSSKNTLSGGNIVVHKK